MSNQDYIIEILRYFSRFVPRAVIKDSFRLPNQSKAAGYDQLVAEMLAYPDTYRIDDISAFIVSTNREFVLDKVKNSGGISLFVEYGTFSFDPIATDGVSEKMGVTVCKQYNKNNNDNLNEALLMNRCNNIVNSILLQMQEDQEQLDSCMMKLIKFPAQVLPIDPEQFASQSGWSALFDNETSLL